MKRLTSFLIVMLWMTSCAKVSEHIIPYTLQITPHNSNKEIYTEVPLNFNAQPIKGWIPQSGYAVSLYVNSKLMDTRFSQYTFTSPGTYNVTVRVNTGTEAYELDTVLNVVAGPPLFGNPRRGEKVLFSWKSSSDYKALLSTYHGSSAADYEILSVSESLKQAGSLTKIDLGSYPQIIDHAVSSNGKLALAYDQTLNIYDADMNLEHQNFFGYTRPRKLFAKENKAFLLFDSLSHVSIKHIDFSTGKIVKGPTRFVGVEGFKVFNHFFIDELRALMYYSNPNNSKTLLMGVKIAGDVEFSRYFQPPLFVNDVTPVSNGGYIITAFGEYNLTVTGADDSMIAKWSKTFTSNLPPTGQFLFRRVHIRELEDHVYVFFDNMRCIKISKSGQVIWDKYFYPVAVARLDDVVLTTSQEFIMFGTRWISSNDQLDLELKSDIVCIKINKEGYRTAL